MEHGAASVLRSGKVFGAHMPGLDSPKPPKDRVIPLRPWFDHIRRWSGWIHRRPPQLQEHAPRSAGHPGNLRPVEASPGALVVCHRLRDLLGHRFMAGTVHSRSVRVLQPSKECGRGEILLGIIW